MTFSYTTTKTFTRTSAEYIASKVMTDLKRLQIYYGKPSDAEIWDYYVELVELLVNRYLASCEYGFKKQGLRVVTLSFEVRPDGSLHDGNPGGVFARANVSGGTWYSFLTHSWKFDALSQTERDRFKGSLPVKRTPGQAPADGNGYWTTDRSYSSDGVGTQRRTFREY